MNIMLAILGSIVGLFVTGAAIATAWAYFAARGKPEQAEMAAEQPEAAQMPVLLASPPWSWLLRWTVADYAIILLFSLGAVFLLADLVGAARERDLYPQFHYPYLLCGIAFSLIGMLFSFVRLALVLKLASRLRTLGGNTDKPHHAEQTKQGIQR